MRPLQVIIVAVLVCGCTAGRQEPAKPVPTTTPTAPAPEHAIQATTTSALNAHTTATTLKSPTHAQNPPSTPGAAVYLCQTTITKVLNIMANCPPNREGETLIAPMKVTVKYALNNSLGKYAGAESISDGADCAYNPAAIVKADSGEGCEKPPLESIQPIKTNATLKDG
jgi:hypothetical protein